MNIFDNFTKKELETIIHKYDTWAEILKELGTYDKHNKMVPLLKNKLKELHIDYSFIDNTPIRIGNSEHCRNKYTKLKDEEIFIKNGNVSLSTVRRAFKKHTEIPYECAICHIKDWNGKPLVFTMDHIDGNTNNNEISNLRWICPNCDRQLPTYAGKNKKRIHTRPLIPKEERKSGKNNCPICGKEKEAAAKLCIKCSQINSRKVERPSREMLKSEIRSNSFLSLSKKYKVSDNAIKKWCKLYNLPYKKSDINKISDKDWKFI